MLDLPHEEALLREGNEGTLWLAYNDILDILEARKRSPAMRPLASSSVATCDYCYNLKLAITYDVVDAVTIKFASYKGPARI